MHWNGQHDNDGHVVVVGVANNANYGVGLYDIDDEALDPDADDIGYDGDANKCFFYCGVVFFSRKRGGRR